MTVTLTLNGIKNAFAKAGSPPESTILPEIVLQVIHLKHLQSSTNGGADRYKLVVSDGSNYMSAMLSSQLNSLVTSNALARYSVLKVKRYMVNVVNSNGNQIRIMIIVDLEIIGQEIGRIGEPVDIAESSKNAMEDVKPTVMGNSMQNKNMNTGYIAPKKENINNFAKTENMGNTNVNTVPISVLSPYQNKWTICARVINKSEIRRWSNSKGDGKLFSVTFADASGEIRATGFNDAVDAHYDKLIENSVFLISKAQIKAANKQYSNVQNDYEITFDPDTSIVACADSSVPGIRYNPVLIGNLMSVEKDMNVDIIAIVKETGALSDLISKNTQKPLKKRELTLVDSSGYQVKITLWGKTAESFEHYDAPVVAFKGVKVGDYGGRSLSMSNSASMSLNPDLPEAHQLRGWYDLTGSNMNFATFSGGAAGISGLPGSKNELFRPISAIKDEHLGQGEKPDYLTLRCTVTFIRSENMSYPACPSEGCNKKVLESGTGWRCEKCDRSYPEPDHRYILSLTVSDYSGQTWLQAFNDVGVQIMGMSANELLQLKNSDEIAFNAYVNSRCCTMYDFRIRIKTENYNEETKVKCSINTATPLDYSKACGELAEMIKGYHI